jgi:uncharacterized protein
MTTPADKPPASPQSDRPSTPQVIQAYGNGGFTTSGVRHEGAVMVLRTRTMRWSPPDDLANLTAADFAPVTEASADVDIVLLGCGLRAVLLPGDLRAQLKAAGVTVECMDTGAACRTFNLLQIEGRRVAAMLVAVP